MKFLGFSVLLVVLFIMGYALQPTFAPFLARNAADVPSSVQAVKVNGMEVKVDLENSELPEKVKLKEGVTLSSEDGSITAVSAAGTEVKVLSHQAGIIKVVEEAQGLMAEIPARKTDIFEVLATSKLAQLVNNIPQPAAPAPAPAPTPATPAVAQNDQAPDPAPVPAPMPEPMPDPAPEPEPQPEPAPVVAANLDEGGIVSCMQESIKSGAVKEFTFKDVQGWKAGEEEDVDGETYQTGLAAYKAETIFGVRNVQAKVLIQGGKVVKWVYAKTGMEIR